MAELAITWKFMAIKFWSMGVTIKRFLMITSLSMCQIIDGWLLIKYQSHSTNVKGTHVFCSDLFWSSLEGASLVRKLRSNSWVTILRLWTLRVWNGSKRWNYREMSQVLVLLILLTSSTLICMSLEASTIWTRNFFFKKEAANSMISGRSIFSMWMIWSGNKWIQRVRLLKPGMAIRWTAWETCWLFLEDWAKIRNIWTT